MGSRKLVRDFFLAKQIVFLRPQSSIQTPNLRLPSFSANGYSNFRRFGVFNEFSKQVKGEAKSNTDFQQSIKELKDKAEELKEVKEDLKVRTKKTTKQIYKHVDGVWTEAEATAKKVSANVKGKISAARVEVSANVKEKISAARVEVKETFGFGKQESSGSTSTSGDSNATHAKDETHATSGAETKQGPESSSNQEAPGASETLFGRFKSSVTSTSPKVSMAFQKLKDAKLIELAKKGIDIIKDELDSNPRRRKRVERSSATGIVVVPTTRWDAFKEKVQNHPIFKRISGISEPVVNKGQELAEDVREIWETSDHPVVHKIQDLNETVFGETAAALSFKEIRRRDPSFSLPDFVAEVQEMIRPTLHAYLKGDMETLKKSCSPEVIERCKAERSAYESQGIFFDNKILHIADIEVRETKMMGTTPIIIVAFQTQQVYCVRDRNGSITEGGKDTIHTVYYAWAMQQLDPEELSDDAIYPVWRLREMQQLGFQALI